MDCKIGHCHLGLGWGASGCKQCVGGYSCSSIATLQIRMALSVWCFFNLESLLFTKWLPYASSIPESCQNPLEVCYHGVDKMAFVACLSSTLILVVVFQHLEIWPNGSTCKICWKNSFMCRWPPILSIMTTWLLFRQQTGSHKKQNNHWPTSLTSNRTSVVRRAYMCKPSNCLWHVQSTSFENVALDL